MLRRAMLAMALFALLAPSGGCGMMQRTFNCQERCLGCGDIYWGDWKSCRGQPCDDCGNWCGHGFPRSMEFRGPLPYGAPSPTVLPTDDEGGVEEPPMPFDPDR